jgi:hypothetical protein
MPPRAPSNQYVTTCAPSNPGPYEHCMSRIWLGCSATMGMFAGGPTLATRAESDQPELIGPGSWLVEQRPLRLDT